MKQPIPAGYESIEAQIHRARIERSVVLAQIFANAADSFGRGIGRLTREILGSFSHARLAHTVEADTLLGRTFPRR